MPKKKKYPKLPNGYGSIKRLSGNRRNPFGVYPPATEQVAPGQYAQPKAICYVDNYMKGFAVLTAWHAGTYYDGYERTLNTLEGSPDKLLADYSQAFRKGEDEIEERKPTFAEVYERFFKYKYEDSARSYSASSINSTRAAFMNCRALHDMTFEDIRHADLQKVLDDCPKKHSSLELICSLLHQMYAYAEIYEIVDRDYSAHIRINKADDDERGVPFSDEDLRVLWQHKDDPTVAFILIMCYSGFRIKAYESIEVNLKERYFKGGVKTRASKDRIVPIHSGIYDLVADRMNTDGSMLMMSTNAFRVKMYSALESLGIDRHTPHDCRHTFSRLCEKYGVSDNDRKRMLGHSFEDVTNRVYGHREIEDLRREIEKIQICH